MDRKKLICDRCCVVYERADWDFGYYCPACKGGILVENTPHPATIELSRDMLVIRLQRKNGVNYENLVKSIYDYVDNFNAECQ